MIHTLLASKIHNCILTGACLDYTGSISVDRKLLDAAEIMPFEQVHVLNITNGSRLITYAIAAPEGSGRIELNGAAAHKGEKGDRIIIMTYVQLTQSEIIEYNPKVVIVDQNNHLQEIIPYTMTTT